MWAYSTILFELLRANSKWTAGHNLPPGRSLATPAIDHSKINLALHLCSIQETSLPAQNNHPLQFDSLMITAWTSYISQSKKLPPCSGNVALIIVAVCRISCIKPGRHYNVKQIYHIFNTIRHTYKEDIPLSSSRKSC